MPRILRPSLKNLEGRKELVGAEIGVFLGANSETILQNLDIKKLYLIDPYHEGYCLFKIAGYKSFMAKEEAHKRLTPYSDKIVWVEDSTDSRMYYIDDVFDFVYVDGDHKYDGVMKDLNNFYPLLKDGGVIGGHDFDKEDAGNQVVRAVYDFFNALNKDVHFDADPYDNRTKDWWVFK